MVAQKKRKEITSNTFCHPRALLLSGKVVDAFRGLGLLELCGSCFCPKLWLLFAYQSGWLEPGGSILVEVADYFKVAEIRAH